MTTNLASSFNTLPSSTGLTPKTNIPFDSLPRASFLGIEFLCEGVSIKGGLRDHVHEYMHTPGGKPEKLGRKLYTIEMQAVFLADHPIYKTGWPGDIGLIRAQLENQTSGDLVIPTVGTIKAYGFDWEEVNSPKMRNGERMRISFREDQDIDQLVDSVIALQYTNVGAQATKVVIVAQNIGFPTDIIQSILDLANQVQALVDQVDLQADLLATKADQLATACRTFDALEKRLNDPVNHELVASIQSLGVAAANLNNDLLQRVIPLGEYQVTLEMSVSQASTAIYGDTSHAVDIMKLNPLEDPFAIAPGTVLRYYLVPPLASAA